MFRVGTNVWVGYEPLYLARSLNWLDEDTARLVEFQSNTEVIRAFRNGVVEAAALTLDEALLLAQDGIDCRIVQVLDYSQGGDVILGRKGIASLAAARGKRVGVESTAVGAYMLARGLQKSGMSIADVQIISMGIDVQERAFNAGKVDVVVTFDPVRTRLLKGGAVRLFDSAEIPGEIVDVLVVRGDFLERYPDRVRRLLAAWNRALAAIDRDPDDSARRMAVREKISPAEMHEALKGVRFPDADENRAMVGSSAPALLPVAERLGRVMLDAKLLAHPVDMRRLFPSEGSRK
jgi:NitT/TauT family transport system substrate-binding protein